MVNVPGKICLRSSSYLQRSILCLDKVCKKWLQHKIGRNNKDPFQYSCGFLHRSVRFLGLLRRKDVVDRKRSRRKGEREETKSRENREFEQCTEVESSENELLKTDQGMDKIVKALITDATDEKRTPKNVRNRSSSGGGSWNCHICGSHYTCYWLVARYLQRLRAFPLENERAHFPFFQRKSPGTEKSCTSPIFCYRGSWLTQLLIPPPLCVFRALILTFSMFFQLWFNFFILCENTFVFILYYSDLQLDLLCHGVYLFECFLWGNEDLGSFSKVPETIPARKAALCLSRSHSRSKF